jgi:hypothetical protein
MEWRGGQTSRLLVVCLAGVALTIASGGIGLADETDEVGVDEEVAWQAHSVQTQGGAAPELSIDADDIRMEAKIEEDGSAEMVIDYGMRLDTNASEAAFEDLRAEVESDPGAYLDPFEERMNRTVDAAEATTDREMDVDGFRITTERVSQLQAEFGHVRFRFEWAGFARTGDGTISAGDAVDSLFLDDSERLVFQWPDGYGIESSNPAPQRTEKRSAVWRGPIDFESGQPRLELSTSAAGGGSDDTGGEAGGSDGSSSDGTEGDGEGGDGLAVVPVVGVLGLLLVAGAGVAVFVLRNDEDPLAGGSDDSDVAGSPPDELLSNEERVLQLLRENGGRMKQKQVAEQLDWTAAKTSQVVGDLREDEEVDAFRLGRENVLTLPDVDIGGGATEGEETGDGGDTGAGSRA